ncbi:MAG: hypothetical protein ND866_32325 [Pyrinomonadaceae bacterium]|nr:hypothetical protein [Pyrinomonadaceae bacterium]
MRFSFTALILMSILIVQGSVLPGLSQTSAPPTLATKLDGQWRVKFIISGVEKNLIFDAKAKGYGLFLLLDTGVQDSPTPNPLPGTWSQLTNDRVSFSGEAELPIGTCCREMGTILFKGKFSSMNAISGRLIFVTSVDEEESPYKFHTIIGTFTGTRTLK